MDIFPKNSAQFWQSRVEEGGVASVHETVGTEICQIPKLWSIQNNEPSVRDGTVFEEKDIRYGRHGRHEEQNALVQSQQPRFMWVEVWKDVRIIGNAVQ